MPRKRKNVKNVSSVSNAASTRSVVEEGQSSSNGPLVPAVEPTTGDYVGAVYDRKAYIGVVNDMDEDEAEIYFLSHNGGLIAKQSLNSQKKEMMFGHRTMFGYRYQIYSALYQNPLLRSEARLKCVRKFWKM